MVAVVQEMYHKTVTGVCSKFTRLPSANVLMLPANMLCEMSNYTRVFAVPKE